MIGGREGREELAGQHLPSAAGGHAGESCLSLYNTVLTAANCL